MDAIAVAKLCGYSSHQHLWGGILTDNPAHVLATPFFSEAVQRQILLNLQRLLHERVDETFTHTSDLSPLAK